VGQLASEKTVLFLCHRGDRSLDAAAYFAGHGVERVRAVRGGIDAWSMEVDPDVPRYTLGE
jgi:rhodanese-related sulfurtransferase